VLFHFGVLFNSSLRVKDCHLILVGHDLCIWSCRLKVLLLVRLSCCYSFLFVVPFQICCSISDLLFISYFAVPFLICCSISCHLLFWCEEWSKAIVSTNIHCPTPRSMICSLIYLSPISLQRDELLLLNPWLINCLVFWMCSLIFWSSLL